ncbi:hypothetical protein Ciccas_007623 [Cichlidogyrus casuarinus]|uniref:Uncharacterized protein n=1 Tax=Cichlidogyrus casuarinus TaxID=1844966 RepID=A0ABD2Q2F2_9PLAT
MEVTHQFIEKKLIEYNRELCNLNTERANLETISKKLARELLKVNTENEELETRIKFLQDKRIPDLMEKTDLLNNTLKDKSLREKELYLELAKEEEEMKNNRSEFCTVFDTLSKDLPSFFQADVQDVE